MKENDFLDLCIAFLAKTEIKHRDIQLENLLTYFELNLTSSLKYYTMQHLLFSQKFLQGKHGTVFFSKIFELFEEFHAFHLDFENGFFK